MNNRIQSTGDSDVQPNQVRLVASSLHTILLVGFVGINAYLAKIRLHDIQAAGNVNRIHLYERTMLVEWLLFAAVLAGVWWKGLPITAVLGDGWHSAKDMIRDLGIAVVFLVFSVTLDSIFVSVVRGHGHTSSPDASVQYLLPRGKFEIGLWIMLAITAGICEETIYRGYFQRQFSALTKNIPLGILFSATMFGIAHSYQGMAHAVRISGLGAMAGILAYWRNSLRPGMIAHAMQDILAVIVKH